MFTMFQTIQKNFLFIWILVLLTIAVVLTLTFNGCSPVTTVQKSENTAAAANATIPQDLQPQPQACIDSDAGKDTTIRGKVAVGNVSYMDKCSGPFLIEYYCENGNVVTQNFRCEKGCDNGACS